MSKTELLAPVRPRGTGMKPHFEARWEGEKPITVRWTLRSRSVSHVPK